MKKIIFVCYLPLSAVYEKNLYIAQLQSEGMSVEYWDISKAFFRHIAFPNVIDRPYVRRFETLEAVDSAIIKEDASTLYIMIITFDAMTLGLYRMFTRHKSRLGYFERGMLPSPSAVCGIAGKIRRVFSLRGGMLARIAVSKALRLLKKAGYIKDFDVVFAAGAKAASIHCSTSALVKINYFDYDNYLALGDGTAPVVPGRYAVFLDDNLIHDPDFKIVKSKTLEAERYYGLMNLYFERLEKKYNLAVVIAAHPKSDYRVNPFGGRKIFNNLTNELSKDCVFAITHFSTSVTYPILYKKPVIFAYADEMKAFPYFAYIEAFAKALGRETANITEQPVQDVQPVDEPLYGDYRYEYLTSPETEHQVSSDIVVRYFKRCSEQTQY